MSFLDRVKAFPGHCAQTVSSGVSYAANQCSDKIETGLTRASNAVSQRCQQLADQNPELVTGAKKVMVCALILTTCFQPMMFIGGMICGVVLNDQMRAVSERMSNIWQAQSMLRKALLLTAVGCVAYFAVPLIISTSTVAVGIGLYVGSKILSNPVERQGAARAAVQAARDEVVAVVAPQEAAAGAV